MASNSSRRKKEAKPCNRIWLDSHTTSDLSMYLSALYQLDSTGYTSTDLGAFVRTQIGPATLRYLDRRKPRMRRAARGRGQAPCIVR